MPYYLAILSLPLLVGTVLFLRTFAVLEDEIAARRILQLEVARDAVDEFMRRVDYMLLLLGEDSDIAEYAAGAEGHTDRVRFDDVRIARRIARYTFAHPLLRGLYVYFPNRGAIVRNGTFFPSISHFYRHFFSVQTATGRDQSLAEWIALSFSGMRYRHLLAESVYLDSEYDSSDHAAFVLPYAQSLPVAHVSTGWASALVAIDRGALVDLLTHYLDLDAGYAMVLDANRSQVAATTADDHVVYRPSPAIYSGPYVSRVRDEGTELSVTFVRSNYTEWVFAAVQPTNVFWARLRNIQQTTLLVFLLLIVVGIVASLAFAFTSSRSIRDISRMLSSLDMADVPARAAEGGRDLLSGSVSDLIRRYEFLSNSMEENRPALRAAFLDRLLRGELHSNDEISTMSSRVALSLTGPLFCAIVVRISGHHGHISADELTELEVRGTLVRRLVEVSIPSAIVHGFTDSEIAVIVQHDTSVAGELRDTVASIASRLRDQVSAELGFRVQVGAGAVCDTPILVSRSFSQARGVLEYQRFTASDDVMLPSDMPSEYSPFHYPPDLEVRLLSAVQAGNLENLKSIFEEIDERNFVSNTLPRYMVKGLLENLEATLIKATGQIGEKNMDDTVLDEVRASIEGDRVMAFDEIRSHFIGLTRLSHRRRSHHYDELAFRVKEYVDVHYSDRDLSLAGIAELFDLTDTYLCKIFKAHTGQKLFTYIQESRMNRAIGMLADHHNTVEGVAYACGYSNVSTFRRAFKRHTGVSPSDYRHRSVAVGDRGS